MDFIHEITMSKDYQPTTEFDVHVDEDCVHSQVPSVSHTGASYDCLLTANNMHGSSNKLALTNDAFGYIMPDDGTKNDIGYLAPVDRSMTTSEPKYVMPVDR